MTFFPDPERDGTYKLRLNNGDGKQARVGIPAGASPVAYCKTAGFGWEIQNANGTVIWSLSESGGVTPTAFILPVSASDPSSPTQGQIYYNTTDGTIKLYNGSAWVRLVVTA